jgi:hypothetical protein
MIQLITEPKVYTTPKRKSKAQSVAMAFLSSGISSKLASPQKKLIAKDTE